MPSVYEIITNTIIEKLENVNPNDWEKPWFNLSNGGYPMNVISKKQYKGINTILLSNLSYESPYFATFKQWKEKDCYVNKGEKAHVVCFFKMDKRTDSQGNEQEIPMWRYYKVFNSEQVTGDYARACENSLIENMTLKEHGNNKELDSFIDNYHKIQRVKKKQGDNACYSLKDDYIQMPLLGQFKTSEAYYSTYFHEIGHSTGSQKRLKRFDPNNFFDTKENYAKEELVAELCSAMLCASLNVSQKPREDHVKYIKAWLQALRNDKKFIFSASSQAQKACDFTLNAMGVYEEQETKIAA